LAKQAREFRKSRRLNRRRNHRIDRLINFWKEKINSNIENDIKNYLNVNNLNLVGKKRDNLTLFNVINTRYLGLSEQINLNEFFLSLLHIAKNRGYNNSFQAKTNEDESEKKKNKKNEEKEKEENWSKSIEKRDELIKKHKFICKAIINEKELFRKKENENNQILDHILSIRNHKNKMNVIWMRNDYINEIEAIFDKQSYYEPKFNKEFRGKINKIIFQQRYFEKGPTWDKKTGKTRFKVDFSKNTGMCTFYNDQKRISKASFLHEASLIVNKLSSSSSILELLNKENNLFSEKEKRLFTSNIINSLWVIPWNPNFSGKIDGNTIKKEVKKIIIEIQEKWENKEKKTKKEKIEEIIKNLKFSQLEFRFLKMVIELKFNENYSKAFEIFKIPQFTDLIKNDEKTFWIDFGEIIVNYISLGYREEKLKKLFVKNNLKLKKEELDKLLNDEKIKVKFGHANTSEKFLKEVLKAFIEEAKPYGKFQDEIKKKIESQLLNKELHISKEENKFIIKNPIVFRVVNLTVKLISKLIKKYKFENINVEFVRDLYKSLSDRRSETELINKKEKENNKIRKELCALGQSLSFNNITKLKLWIAQNKSCLYCLEQKDKNFESDIKEIFKDNKYNIDHIIPRKYTEDDSLENKVLVHKECNFKKGDRIPIQYFNDEKKSISFINKYKKLIKNCKQFSKRKKDFLLKNEISDDDKKRFSERMLNDTSYIARLVFLYLKQNIKIISNKVNTINGIVTGNLRKYWLSNSAWGLKNLLRDITPYHHTVDAIILSQFTNKWEIKLFSDLVNISQWGKRLKNKKFDLDFQNYLKKFRCFGNEIKKSWNNTYLQKYRIQVYQQKFSDFLEEWDKHLCDLIDKEPELNGNLKNIEKIIEKIIPVKLKKKAIKEGFKLFNEEASQYEFFYKSIKQETYFKDGVKKEKDNFKKENFIPINQNEFTQKQEEGKNKGKYYFREYSEYTVEVEDIIWKEEFEPNEEFKYPIVFHKKNHKLNKNFSSSENQESNYEIESDKVWFKDIPFSDISEENYLKKNFIIKKINENKGNSFFWIGKNKSSIGKRIMVNIHKNKEHKSYWDIASYYGLLINKKTKKHEQIPYILAKKELNLFFANKKKDFPKNESLLIRKYDLVEYYDKKDGKMKIIVFRKRNYNTFNFIELGLLRSKEYINDQKKDHKQKTISAWLKESDKIRLLNVNLLGKKI
jgi:CRISPR-associated endonuclease Csn1